jgi:serine/threonine protein kinase
LSFDSVPDLLASDPRVVGRYQLLGRIGQGGMGVVFLAKDLEGRKVALKLIRPELAKDPDFRARFALEVEAGRRVGGVSTVRYLDAELGNEPYLVTEYVPGGNLFDFVTVHGPLSWDRLVSVAIGLAQALVAMNAVGVIHRDLKPTNVLLATSGPKVADFGISHALDGTAVTQTGSIVGSPAWMAPELAVGSAATPASDVFAWGATVAFAGTGHSPFGDGRPDDVLYRVVNQEPDLQGLDPRLLPVLLQALQKDPRGRPYPEALLIHLIRTATTASAGGGDPTAMATAFLDRTWSPPAGPTSPSEGIHPSSGKRRRRRTGIWLVAAVLALVAGTVAGRVVANWRSTSHRAVPAQSKSSRTHSTDRTGSAPTSAGANPAGGVTITTTPAAATKVSADLPLNVCQTTFGVQPNSIPVLPSTIAESVPVDLTSQLAVYTDQLGNMKLFAPAGWSCSALEAADGGSYVSAFPRGQPDPESSTSGTAEEAVVGGWTGPCSLCTLGQASPLFSDAATLCAQEYGGNPDSCPSLPAGETTIAIAPGVVGFLDPPGVRGDGIPSGGTNPANGVMTYLPATSQGSYLDTCTLPEDQHALCTASLNNFTDVYGST